MPDTQRIDMAGLYSNEIGDATQLVEPAHRAFIK
jgi:hypothetical protein